MNISLGVFPGRTYTDALKVALSGVSEPLWGDININHVQLCPQNSGRLTMDTISTLLDMAPKSKFRLHANVHVMEKHNPLLSLTSFWRFKHEFKEMAKLSKALGAPCYTLHAGRKIKNTSPDLLRRAILILEDMFECPVGVEGHYPTPPENKFNLSTWEDHRRLFYDTDMKFVIDLSHFNIIKEREGACDLDLLYEMISSPRCLEVHVSGNEGNRDEHCQLISEQWWHSLLEKVNTQAIVFTEGIQNKRRAKFL